MCAAKSHRSYTVAAGRRRLSLAVSMCTKTQQTRYYKALKLGKIQVYVALNEQCVSGDYISTIVSPSGSHNNQFSAHHETTPYRSRATRRKEGAART